MKKIKFRRYVALFLSLVLLLIATGCQPQSTGTTASTTTVAPVVTTQPVTTSAQAVTTTTIKATTTVVTTTTAAKTTAAPTTVTTTAPKPKVDVSLELNYLPATVKEDQSSNVIVKYIEDKFNVKLHFIPSDVSKQRLHLITGQAGDIVSLPMWKSDAAQLMQQGVAEGMFVDIGALVSAAPDRYKTLAKVFTDKNYQYFNHIYYKNAKINYAFWGGQYAQGSLGAPIYNMQIMKELNLTFPATVDEFISLLATIKKSKPEVIPFIFRNDKGKIFEGENNEVDFNFFQPFGLHMNGIRQDASGNWIDSAIDPANKEAWKRLAKMMQDGLIDPEIFTKDTDTFFANDFAMGKTAVCLNSMPNMTVNSFLDLLTAFNKANPSVAPEDYLNYIQMQPQPLTGPKGSGKWHAASLKANFGSVITKTSKNPDRALEVLNWIGSDEGQTMLYYGIKGTHYDSIDSTGKVVGFKPDAFKQDNENWGLGGTLTFGFTLLSGSGVIFLPDRYGWSDSLRTYSKIDSYSGFSNAVVDYAKKSYADWTKTAFIEDPPYSAIGAVNPDVAAKLREIKVKYFVGFVFGSIDIDSQWDAFASEYKDAGLEKYIADVVEMNRSAKAVYENITK